MEREFIGGIENRTLYLSITSFSILLMFLGLITPSVNGTVGAALLVQQGTTILGSGSWASLYLITCSGLLVAWMVWSRECPLLARIVLTVPGGVVLLLAAMQGAVLSDALEATEGIGLGPGYWLLGAGGALLFLSSVLASLAEWAPEFSISVTHVSKEENDD